MIASFYIFLYDKESQSIYINYLAIAINLSGVYFLFGQSFIKPKSIGILKITDEKVEFDKNGLNKSILFGLAFVVRLTDDVTELPTGARRNEGSCGPPCTARTSASAVASRNSRTNRFYKTSFCLERMVLK